MTETLDRLVSHVRYAIRLLARERVFTLTAIASLAIGIGANTTVFTLANALLLAPTRGIPDAAHVIDIGSVRGGHSFDTMSFPTYQDLRDRNTTLSGLYAVGIEPRPIAVGDARGAEAAQAQEVSGGFFDTLQLSPAAGTFFHTRDEQPGTPLRTVVLSYAYWTRRFGKDPAIAGRDIVLNGDHFTIAGVAPDGFQGTTILSADLWVPLTSYANGLPDDHLLRGRQNTGFILGGRLKPGVTVAQASAELNAIHASLAKEYPGIYRTSTVSVAATSRIPGEASEIITPIVVVLMSVVALVLLVACANLAGLLLARAAGRQRELAIRLSLGARRRDVVAQLLTESMLLAVIGGASALLLARWMTSAMLGLLPLLPFTVDLGIAFDSRVLLFTLGVTLVTGVLTGMAPAIQSSRPNLNAVLKSDSSSPARQRLRHVFVAAQMGLCLLLIVVAGLFLRALGAAMQVDPGFRVEGVEIASVNFALGRYTDATVWRATNDLRERFSALPGVSSVATAAVVPLEGSGLGLGEIRRPGDTGANAGFDADWNVISPEFLPTLGVPLVRGRNFSADDRAEGLRVAIVNERFAALLWPGADPIGRTLVVGDFRPGHDRDNKTLTIVGVAKDAKYRWLGDSPRSFLYVDAAQEPWQRVSFLIRSSATGASAELAPALRHALRSFDPNLPLTRLMSLRDFADLGMLPQRLIASVAATLGTLALLLAAIGVYGVTAYAVASRTREFGIRIALGADGRAIGRLVLRLAARLTIVGGGLGLLAGMAAAVGLSKMDLLFGVSPIDPLAFGGTITALALVTLIGCAAPARRAVRVNPILALRAD